MEFGPMTSWLHYNPFQRKAAQTTYRASCLQNCPMVVPGTCRMGQRQMQHGYRGGWARTYLQSHGLELLHYAQLYACLLQGGMYYCFGLIKSTQALH